MIQIATRSEILKCLLCSYLPQSSFQLLSSTSWRSRTVTSTLFLVTLGSLLTILPTIIFISLLVFHFEFLRSFSRQSSFNFLLVMDLLFFTNSLINPIIYAVRMPKVRATVIQLLFDSIFYYNRRRTIVPLPLSAYFKGIASLFLSLRLLKRQRSFVPIRRIFVLPLSLQRNIIDSFRDV